MSTPSKYPRPTHTQVCHMFASMMFGLDKQCGFTPAQFWEKLSDELQKDISDFVKKWPPGQSKERGCYREFPKVKSTNNSDETEIATLG